MVWETTVVAIGDEQQDNLLFLTVTGTTSLCYTLKHSKAEFKQAVLDNDIPWRSNSTIRRPGTGIRLQGSASKVMAKIELTKE